MSADPISTVLDIKARLDDADSIVDSADIQLARNTGTNARKPGRTARKVTRTLAGFGRTGHVQRVSSDSTLRVINALTRGPAR